MIQIVQLCVQCARSTNEASNGGRKEKEEWREEKESAPNNQR